MPGPLDEVLGRELPLSTEGHGSHVPPSFGVIRVSSSESLKEGRKEGMEAEASKGPGGKSSVKLLPFFFFVLSFLLFFSFLSFLFFFLFHPSVGPQQGLQSRCCLSPFFFFFRAQQNPWGKGRERRLPQMEISPSGSFSEEEFLFFFSPLPSPELSLLPFPCLRSLIS